MVSLNRHVDIGGELEIQGIGIEQGDPPADEAGLFQRLDPAGAGGGGEADAFRQLQVAQLAMLLQQGQNAAIGAIQFQQASSPG